MRLLGLARALSLLAQSWSTVRARSPRRFRHRGSLRHASRVTLPLAGVCLALLFLTSVQLTAATLADQITTSQVAASAGTVNAPTGLALSEQPTAIRAAWTLPAGGLPPSNYEIFRRPDSGSYGGAPTQTVAAPTTQWDDTTASECVLWWYKVRSKRVNLASAFSAEQALRVDRTSPTVSNAHVVWQGASPPVANFVRVSPGGDIEAYANVADNCDNAGSLTVQFSFGPPFNTTVTPTYNAGGWTPIPGGPTYNYRFQYTLPAFAVADGQTVTWSVSATDTTGNNSVTPGTTFTGDGQAPVFQRAAMVSAFTNFYDETGLGYGEIPSDGTARLTGSYVYAAFSDTSGIGAISADLATGGIKTGTSALALAPGSYSTYSGTAWGWRSAATQIDTGLADGTRTFTVTATDGVGNTATTSPAQTVAIDDSIPDAGSTTCTNGGGSNNNTLSSPDYTDFAFGTDNTIFPGSIRPGWDGSDLAATATLYNNGSNDYFDFNTAFGIQLFQGTGATQGFTLGTNAVASNTNYSNTFGFQNRSTLRMSYGAGTASVPNGGNTTAYIGTSLRDAAGNKVAANFTETCSRNPW